MLVFEEGIENGDMGASGREPYTMSVGGSKGVVSHVQGQGTAMEV